MQAVLDRRNILRYLIIPAVIGLVAVIAVHRLLARAGRAAGPTPVPVVVARQIIPARTPLSASLVTIKEFPPGLIGRTAIHDLAGVAGRTTTQPLAAGEVVYSNALAGRGDNAALSYHIPPGLRALTISVNEEIAVADMLEPGDRVDILGVTRSGARAVETGVAVLAVGQNQDTTLRPPDPGSVHSITLAVTPGQAVAVVTAEHTGALRLLLEPAATPAPGAATPGTGAAAAHTAAAAQRTKPAAHAATKG